MADKILDLYSGISGLPLEALRNVEAQYPVSVTPFLLKRFKEGSYSLQALKQFMPDIRELDSVDGYITDPTGEANLHPEKSVLQTYHNRLALVLTNRCLVYCRFCFRKSFVGQPGDPIITDDNLSDAIKYIEAHTEIEDVLLSGGDPLALPNSKLIPFLEKLLQFSHIKTIRIHSRALSANPSRIDDVLVKFLSSDTLNRFWYYAHMNHPDDLNHPDVISAAKSLQSARIPILNQSVILGGVNDDQNVMRQLMQLCYENKIIPYNLYVLDKVKGVAHFEVSREKIIEIYKSLSTLSGPAQPVLVYVDQNSRKHRIVYDDDASLDNFLMNRK